MSRLLRQVVRCEGGQALPIVLALLLVGGLTVAGSLRYATTVLKGTEIVEEDIRGMYAAEAGVEQVIWSITEGLPPPTELAESLNHMDVTMVTGDPRAYTLYLGEMVQPGAHSDYVTVTTDLVWDPVEEAYKYTITVTWQSESGYPVIHLEEIGAKAPDGFSYKAGSAAGFGDNLSTEEPDETAAAGGGWMLNWELSPPLPDISSGDPVETQTFYLTGTGDTELTYAWLVASRADIGAVGEISGTAYRITAEAARSGDSLAAGRIVADIVVEAGTVNIVSWRVWGQ